MPLRRTAAQAGILQRERGIPDKISACGGMTGKYEWITGEYTVITTGQEVTA